ncbi:hypothetical protein ANOM_000467 [Aspergillus nomiae NRRL 13137]|uniref:SRR1-like domain-containing protein n=1 Tax=Aspergillus nomiae NRRL (strain ATCC 15546 / NRRL 13137 / CBS 260.88 / M93) TaxID=1509407 RepID=A0A0L1JI19_ASPN3|nr:uncharacterized protein ANOM_000467 [Aspergillus nomiae NRRL 13137]KNG91420.1 hypothetical protein ANOM_000467 [Aspergillus nomiae NRRL 13137]
MTDFHKVQELGLDEDTTLKILERLRHISQLYRTGKPLFPRRLLEDLSHQIDEGKEEVYIPDFDDVPQAYSLKVPNWCTDFANTYRINYQSIHYLGCPTPFCPEFVLRSDHAPVTIGTCAPQAQVEVWLESSGRQSLVHHLATLKTTAKIRKIVCFGLGSLGRRCGYHCTRAHTQHAAVETMVASLAKRGLNDNQEIKCYAQDPVYDEVDQEFLRSIGITPLEDPKGFLQVDEHTLVFSVSPNVPVKQIVADLHWPAAMIWNTVTSSEKDKCWVKRTEKNGTVRWTCPFTTDPDSGRVRRMVKHYAQAQLKDPDEYFGDLTIYMKCEE